MPDNDEINYFQEETDSFCNNNIKVACGVTLYNPEQDVLDRIVDYLLSFEKVFVFDNSDDGRYEHIDILKGYNNIVYMGGEGNFGLPYAYNSILSHDEMKDIDYLCTMDQDSIFLKKDIASIINYLKHVDSNRVAAVGPYINYFEEDYLKRDYAVNKSWIITSGTFLNLSIIRNNLIRYDENYFIDKFEIDLCKQLTDLGYLIQMYMGAELKQKLGSESGHRHPNHSPLRHRYLFRNRFYFNHKYYSLPKKWIYNVLQTVRHLLLILLFEEDKTEKIKAFILACHDYKSGRMGRIEG